MLRRFSARVVLQPFFLLFVLSIAIFSAAQTATTTSLAVTANGAPVTGPLGAGTLVTLTATVSAGATPVTKGTVHFCDDTGSSCIDTHLAGSAQLTGSGSATLQLNPPVGAHNYKAVYLGTPNGTPQYSGSASDLATLSVKGASAVTITNFAGSPGTANFLFTFDAFGDATPPNGSFSVIDESNSDAVLSSQSFSISPTATNLFSLAFTNPKILTVTGAAGVGAGDFNGDGKLDLAITDAADGLVTIQFGNGDGTFTQAPLTPSTGQRPYYLVVGDFNGDGKADLATANLLSNTVTVLLGNGDGTFTRASDPATGSHPGPLTVGDWNGDGKLDLAVVNTAANSVTILLGNGDGTFTAVANPPGTGINPNSIVTADLNNDGKADLVVSNSTTPLSGDVLTVLIGNGDGTFTASSQVTNLDTWQLATGDFNHDGKVDLAAVSYSGNCLVVFTGNGDGTFTEQTPITVPGGPSVVAAADFNNDGNLDIAVSTYGATTISLFPGKGDGTFASALTFSAPATQSSAITVGDFDGNGLPDLAISLPYSGEAVTFSTSAKWELKTSTSGTVPGTGPHQIAVRYDGNDIYAASTSDARSVLGGSCPVIPVISPGPGNYAAPLSVSISDVTPGVTIYYSTDGSYPSLTYTSAFTLTKSATVNAFATGGGYPCASGIATADLNIVPPAAITSPAPGSTLPGDTATFAWNAAAGASRYVLTVGTTPGARDVYYGVFPSSTTSVTVNPIPTNGATLYVTLFSYIGGAWPANKYTYTEAGSYKLATLLSPTPGTPLTGSSATFNWDPGAGPTRFVLKAGTTPGAQDVYYGVFPSSTTSANVTGIPTNGATLYVTLFSYINGTWPANKYTYTEAGSYKLATLLTPVPGTQITGNSATFNWDPGAGATRFVLEVGTTPGAKDVYYGAFPSSTTSANVSGIPTSGATLYVTLFSYINGAWPANKYTYTEASH